MAEPDFESIIFQLREPLLRAMSSATLAAWRLVNKQARDSVHAFATKLSWVGTRFTARPYQLAGPQHVLEGFFKSLFPVSAMVSTSELPYGLLQACRNLRSLTAEGMSSLGNISQPLPPTLEVLDLSHTAVFSAPDTRISSLDLLAQGPPAMDVSNHAQASSSSSSAPSPLQPCTALHTLRLAHIPRLDLQPVSVCAALRNLDLGCSYQLQNLSPLSACTQLRSLDLRRCSVHDVSPLSACKQLSCLNLSRNHPLISISPLADCTALRDLDLSYCYQVSSVAPLAACTQLQVLRLRACHELPHLAGLAACTALQSLDLSKCSTLEDINALTACTALTSLAMARCHEISQSSVAAVTSSRRLSQAVTWHYEPYDTDTEDSGDSEDESMDGSVGFDSGEFEEYDDEEPYDEGFTDGLEDYDSDGEPLFPL